MEHAKCLQPHNIDIWDVRPRPTTKLSYGMSVGYQFWKSFHNAMCETRKKAA